MSVARRPERGIEVLWQRHVPQGTGDASTIVGEEVRVGAVVDMLSDLEESLDEFYDALDRGDLVLTLGLRPMET